MRKSGFPLSSSYTGVFLQLEGGFETVLPNGMSEPYSFAPFQPEEPNGDNKIGGSQDEADFVDDKPDGPFLEQESQYEYNGDGYDGNTADGGNFYDIVLYKYPIHHCRDNGEKARCPYAVPTLELIQILLFFCHVAV